MSQKVDMVGRLVGGFDGTIEDNGVVKEYSPSLNIVDNDTLEMLKVKCSPEEYKQFAPMMGQNVAIKGIIIEPPKPAKVQAMSIQAVKK